MSTVTVKSYADIPICEKEILRYARVGEANTETLKLLNSAISEARSVLTYGVCCAEFDISINDGICDFGFFGIESKSLSKNLDGCKRAIVFAATVGVGIDRLIVKYSRISPSRAFMLGAVGAERIEALCDTFCNDMKLSLKAKLRPRFSPGYGDVPLSVQRDVLALLDATRKIGISLNESMLMSPSKSVTAIVGIEK